MSLLTVIINSISFLNESVFDDRSVKTSLFSCNIAEPQLRCHLVKSLLKLLSEYINSLMQRKLVKTRQNKACKIVSLIIDWLRSNSNFSSISQVIKVLSYLLYLSWSKLISVTILFSIRLLNISVTLKLILS